MFSRAGLQPTGIAESMVMPMLVLLLRDECAVAGLGGEANLLIVITDDWQANGETD